MTRREWKAARARIWRDMAGCTCQRVITVDGLAVTLRPNEMCSVRAIRCSGRASRWASDRDKLGPEPDLSR